MKGKGALGKQGEDEVCQYLIRHGHTILERNWRYGHLEIDIVALAPDGIHFVEVKSRVAPVQGDPQDAVNAKKQKNIAVAAGKYMSMKGNALAWGSPSCIWLQKEVVLGKLGNLLFYYILEFGKGDNHNVLLRNDSQASFVSHSYQ